MKLVKEIRSKNGELHFKRWSILETPIFRIYVHEIHKADEEAHLHNHPWDFLVVCLRGRYVERTGTALRDFHFVGPWTVRWRPRNVFHKIHEMQTPTVKTLVLAFGRKTVWGYDVDGKFVDHETYRKLKNKNT